VSTNWKRDAREQLRLRSRLTAIIALRKLLRLSGFNIPKLEIITGVRNVIAVALSAIFENYRYFVPELSSLTLGKRREALLHPKTCKHVQRWFDEELKATIGIDVYSTPFPREQGYAILENHFARLLVYRVEALARLPKVVKEFLGCEITELINRNAGTSKAYADQYQKAKDQLRLPQEFVRGQLSSKLMRHFYSDEERWRFESQWSEDPNQELGIPTAQFQIIEESRISRTA
jgi:hypothetical protein